MNQRRVEHLEAEADDEDAVAVAAKKPTVTGFEDYAEMLRAFSDPRYKTDWRFRLMVEEKIQKPFATARPVTKAFQ